MPIASTPREAFFSADSFVWELADSVIGDHYPSPDRMLRHTEIIARDYLTQELCGGVAPETPFDLFTVEGGTAAMSYLFDSLVTNKILHPGDRVALMTPIFVEPAIGADDRRDDAADRRSRPR